MPSRFQQALTKRPAIDRLGDVAIRYDSSMLIGEADRLKRGWAPVMGLCVAAAGGTSLIAAAVSGGSLSWLSFSVASVVAGLGGAAWLDQRERRQRRFVLNFESYALRLDFSTPIAGRARTLVLDFDRVKSLELREQGDGQLCLTVDFEPARESPQVLREVLVANVPAGAREELERLQRLLHDAFDLDRQNSPVDVPAEVGPDGHRE
jgi:hypothetical protein